MASTPVEVDAPTNGTFTLSLFALGSDTLANSDGADNLTEKTNNLTVYTATVTEALAGWYRYLVKDGSGNAITSGLIYLEDTTTRRYGASDFVSAAMAYVDGKTGQEALRYIAAVCAGLLSGAGTGTETVKGLDESTNRARFTVDSSGNRTAVSYDP